MRLEAVNLYVRRNFLLRNSYIEIATSAPNTPIFNSENEEDEWRRKHKKHYDHP